MSIGDKILVEIIEDDKGGSRSIYGKVVAFDDVFAEVTMPDGRLALVKHGTDIKKTRRYDH